MLEQLHRAASAEAFLVGGTVRDLLLGRPVHDWDVATSALPATVQSVFAHTIPTGLAHGTVTVVHAGYLVEVTSLRREGPYADGRRPDYVEFGATLAEDLARRDFTVNAMAIGWPAGSGRQTGWWAAGHTARAA